MVYPITGSTMKSAGPEMHAQIAPILPWQPPSKKGNVAAAGNQAGGCGRVQKLRERGGEREVEREDHPELPLPSPRVMEPHCAAGEGAGEGEDLRPVACQK